MAKPPASPVKHLARLVTSAILYGVVLMNNATARGDNIAVTSQTFSSGGVALRASLVTPKDQTGPFPVVLFVHGDGALEHDAYGYYRPLWRALAARGIASYSWDKPGVGDSEGDWLSQDMQQRAQEVSDAYHHVKTLDRVNSRSVGLIGFSQAGWVMPKLASQPWVDYMVFVSPAINWIQQGEYLTQVRLRLEGVVEPTRREQLMENERKLDRLLMHEGASYAQYLNHLKQTGKTATPMTPERFHFVKKSMKEDATAELARIRVPVAAFFGELDQNVDINHSLAVYQSLFGRTGSPEFSYRVFQGATLQLWKSRYSSKQVPGLWDLIKSSFLQERMFADGALDAIASFIATHSQQ